MLVFKCCKAFCINGASSFSPITPLCNFLFQLTLGYSTSFTAVIFAAYVLQDTLFYPLCPFEQVWLGHIAITSRLFLLLLKVSLGRWHYNPPTTCQSGTTCFALFGTNARKYWIGSLRETVQSITLRMLLYTSAALAHSLIASDVDRLLA